MAMASAISPSFTTSGRCFMRMGITEVMGSTPRDIDFFQFFDEAEDGIEFGRKMRQIVVGNFDAGKTRDATDEVRIDGHGLSS